MFQHSPFNLTEFENAYDLWEALSPLKPIKPPPSEFIFRGQAEANWELKPSVARENNPGLQRLRSQVVNVYDQIFLEMEILQSFVESCDLLGLKLPNDSIDFRINILNPHNKRDEYAKYPSKWPNEALIELMALAQHHRVPTRLLDWSKRSFVAAYFACSDALSRKKEWKDNEKLAVWALDVNETHFLKYFKIVYTPGSTSINQSAQAGLFTLLNLKGTGNSPSENKCLSDEFKTLPNTPLWKFTLPVTEAKSVLKLCELYNVSAATLFPGYDGAAKTVAEHINMMDCK